jgi:hypothetical protein
MHLATECCTSQLLYGMPAVGRVGLTLVGCCVQAFRKAIGVRIKEETEILEGEVRPAAATPAAAATYTAAHLHVACACATSVCAADRDSTMWLVQQHHYISLLMHSAPCKLLQVVEIEIDRPEGGKAAKTVRGVHGHLAVGSKQAPGTPGRHAFAAGSSNLTWEAGCMPVSP